MQNISGEIPIDNLLHLYVRACANAYHVIISHVSCSLLELIIKQIKGAEENQMSMLHCILQSALLA